MMDILDTCMLFVLESLQCPVILRFIFYFFLANNPYKAKAGPVFLNKTTRSAITPALNRDTMLQVVTKEL